MKHSNQRAKQCKWSPSGALLERGHLCSSQIKRRRLVCRRTVLSRTDMGVRGITYVLITFTKNLASLNTDLYYGASHRALISPLIIRLSGRRCLSPSPEIARGRCPLGLPLEGMQPSKPPAHLGASAPVQKKLYSHAPLVSRARKALLRWLVGWRLMVNPETSSWCWC